MMLVTNKISIVNELKRLYPDLSEDMLEKVVNVFFDELTTALICGDRVELRGFASWVVRIRNKRSARNPKTNHKIDITDKGVLYFRASKELIKNII